MWYISLSILPPATPESFSSLKSSPFVHGSPSPWGLQSALQTFPQEFQGCHLYLLFKSTIMPFVGLFEQRTVTPPHLMLSSASSVGGSASITHPSCRRSVHQAGLCRCTLEVWSTQGRCGDLMWPVTQVGCRTRFI